MRSIPNFSVKRVGDVTPGELIRAAVYGDASLGFLTSTKGDGAETLGLWLEIGNDRSQPELRYVDDNTSCVSYGADWAIEPAMSSVFSYVSGAHLAMHQSLGWLIKCASGRTQFDWYSIADGLKVTNPIRSQTVYFPSYRIFAMAGQHREVELFEFPEQPSKN